MKNRVLVGDDQIGGAGSPAKADCIKRSRNGEVEGAVPLKVLIHVASFGNEYIKGLRRKMSQRFGGDGSTPMGEILDEFGNTAIFRDVAYTDNRGVVRSPITVTATGNYPQMIECVDNGYDIFSVDFKEFNCHGDNDILDYIRESGGEVLNDDMFNRKIYPLRDLESVLGRSCSSEEGIGLLSGEGE